MTFACYKHSTSVRLCVYVNVVDRAGNFKFQKYPAMRESTRVTSKIKEKNINLEWKMSVFKTVFNMDYKYI